MSETPIGDEVAAEFEDVGEVDDPTGEETPQPQPLGEGPDDDEATEDEVSPDGDHPDVADAN